MTVRDATLSYLALLGLLALTVGTSFLPFGLFNSVLNLTIAAAKSAIVGLVFMRLRRASMLVSLTVASLALWLSILFGMTLVDILNR